jgi:hypothetical protein
VNSIGKGLGTVLQGFYGQKGATITPDKNELLPEVYKEYTSNIDEYEKKKDTWNKDMLSLKLKEADEVTAETRQTEQFKRADILASEQRRYQTEMAKEEQRYRTETMIATQDFQREMAAAKSTEEQANLKVTGEQRLREIYAQGAQRMAEIEKNHEYRMKEYKEYGPVGGRGKSGSSSSVQRTPGTENNPLTFRSQTQGQVFLDADQLDIVEDVLNRAAMEMDPNYMLNQKKYEKMLSDGKISESEARSILSAYGDKYYDFVDGKAIEKGTATGSTGGAY